MITPAILFFIVGLAKGLRDTLQFHPAIFFKRFPEANRGWWGAPNQTWQNKYDLPPYLVSISDSWHTLEMIINICSISAILTASFELSYLSPVYFVGLWFVRQAGFYLVYNILFK